MRDLAIFLVGWVGLRMLVLLSIAAVVVISKTAWEFYCEGGEVPWE
jgi:hypothetical protein